MKFTSEQIDFIAKANQTISDDPKSRISQVVRDVLNENNYVFDAHCHIFDGDCINVKYLATRMIAGAYGRFKAWIWRLVTGEQYSSNKSILSTEQMIDLIYEDPKILPDKDLASAISRMEKELDLMEEEAKNMKSAMAFDLIEFIKRYKTIIWLLRSGSMESVYKVFETNYAIHQVINYRTNGNKKLLTVALGMDLNSGWEGSIPKTWEEQNKELAAVSKNYPILPYFPIDPRRTNLYYEFLKAFNENNPQFFGVKCYPALGYLPSDERLMPIFQICEEKNIPIMTHCGGEIISTFENPIKVNRLGEIITINDSNRKDRARKLNEPKEWIPVLNQYKKLRLCLGHYGGGAAWENKPSTAHRIPEILDMMKQYNNLYADFSFNLESLTAIRNFRNKLFKDDDHGKLMKERSLFGTDFWVILPLSDLITDQHNFIVETDDLINELVKTNVLKYLSLV